MLQSLLGRFHPLPHLVGLTAFISQDNLPWMVLNKTYDNVTMSCFLFFTFTQVAGEFPTTGTMLHRRENKKSDILLEPFGKDQIIHISMFQIQLHSES